MSLAREAQSTQNSFAEDGFQAIEIITENNYGSAPSQDELQDWADAGEMETIPVLSDTSQSVWIEFEQDFYIPTIVHLGPDMTVLSVDEAITSPSQFID